MGRIDHGKCKVKAEKRTCVNAESYELCKASKIVRNSESGRLRRIKIVAVFVFPLYTVRLSTDTLDIANSVNEINVERPLRHIYKKMGMASERMVAVDPTNAQGESHETSRLWMSRLAVGIG